MKLPVEFEGLTYLVRSKTTWGSWTQGVLGGKRLRQSNLELGLGKLHHSVNIFDHLGIADYSRHILPDQKEDTQNRQTALIQAIESAIKPLANTATLKFEGDILAQWTKHILCAHVNIRQARNMDEEIKDEDLTSEPVKKKLEQPLTSSGPAHYSATVPVSAILSAVHELVRQQYRTKNSQPLEAFCKQRGMVNKNYVNDVGTYTFSILDNKNPEKASELENELTYLNGTVIFTRIFPLLMGRSHNIQQHQNINRDEIPPCRKCQCIWNE
jgi:hypothetical protein